MLGSLGFFASRGMTTVPDLTGLSKSAAESAITDVGLVVGTTTSVSTSNSSFNNILETQSVQSGSVVDYDTAVNFTYYTFVSSPAPSPTPVVCTGAQNERFQTSWGDCINGVQEGTYAIETCYSNCPCVINYYTETRSCGPAPCVFASQQTYPTNWGPCENGTQSGTITTETSYTNCPSTTSTTSTSRSCTTPAPPSAPAPPTNPLSGPAPSAFPPGTPIAVACVDADTEMIKIDEDGSRSYVPAKEIQIGDYVLSMNWDELVDQNMGNYMNSTSASLTNPSLAPTMVVAKYAYEKNTTMYFNNDISTRMSLEQPILVLRDDAWTWVSSGDAYVGDILVMYNADGSTSETEITAVDYISELRDVYSFNCEDVDTFFAGNVLVHNK